MPPIITKTGRSHYSFADLRSNNNALAAILHAVFLREHNAWVLNLTARNPTWDGVTLAQEARRRVIAELQAITYNEYLPALLGNTCDLDPMALPRARSNNRVDAQVI